MKQRYIAIACMLVLVGIVVPATLTFARSRHTSTPIVGPTPSYAAILQKYAAAGMGGDKVKILIVPGHEPGFGGAVYQGVYEREITVEMADQLAAYLNQDPRLNVIVARSNIAWNDSLQEYFNTNWNSIQDFVTDQKEAFQKLVDNGDVMERTSDDQVAHAAAPDDVALRLYGIDKWANENSVDFMVHLHINDAPDHGPSEPGPNSGYTVYVPDPQYGNASTSLPLGQDIAARLSTMNATSTHEIENKGVVPDQELIALGAYNTLSVPSVLMEYAYITEPKFTHPEVRQAVTKDFAYETYLGIKDYLGSPVVAQYPTASLPFTFATSSLGAIGSSSPSTYALQAALHTIGFYPVATTTRATPSVPATTTLRTLTDCPISGLTGPCTIDAVNAFQKAHGWAPTGALGPKTLGVLNALFSGVPVAQPVATQSSITSPITPAPTAGAGAPSTACSLPIHSLTLNDTDAKTGGDVSRLQTILSKDATIYPQKLVTGTFGPATFAAVKKFQFAQSIVASTDPNYGLVGPRTIAALTNLCK